MIVEFKTTDNTIFKVDTEKLEWSLSSVDLGTSTLENKSGKLTKVMNWTQGAGVFTLDDRTPASIPGNGFCAIGIALVPEQDTVIVGIKGNVELHDLTVPGPLDVVKYELIPGTLKL